MDAFEAMSLVLRVYRLDHRKHHRTTAYASQPVHDVIDLGLFDRLSHSSHCTRIKSNRSIILLRTPQLVQRIGRLPDTELLCTALLPRHESQTAIGRLLHSSRSRLFPSH